MWPAASYAYQERQIGEARGPLQFRDGGFWPLEENGQLAAFTSRRVAAYARKNERCGRIPTKGVEGGRYPSLRSSDRITEQVPGKANQPHTRRMRNDRRIGR